MMNFPSFVFALLSLAQASALDISSDSALGKSLLSNARQLEQDNGYDFLGAYSLKFQGCHHVQQWNDDADDESDVRIKTKRLARFRLCPADQCSNDRSAGCNSKFGDYVVDMSTFVSSYLNAIEEDKENICDDVEQDCYGECNGNDDGYDDCMDTCYEALDVAYCSENYEENNNGFDAEDYSECQQFDFGRRRKLEDGANNQYYYDEDVNYYIGAYCADQGGEIHIGLFTDDTCTTFAQNGETMFYNLMGFELPYSDSSLISSRCLGCGMMDNDNGYYENKEICDDIYQASGKCETRMSVDYPNESSCSYIEGIKIVREDGVIRTSKTKKSKAAAVAIGLFMTFAVLLAGYVYYLRTKLGRAQINLAAASQPLT